MNNSFDQDYWSDEHSREYSPGSALERSLERKLQLLADGEYMGLTAEEAAVYGADYADEWPEDESNELEEEGYDES